MVTLDGALAARRPRALGQRAFVHEGQRASVLPGPALGRLPRGGPRQERATHERGAAGRRHPPDVPVLRDRHHMVTCRPDVRVAVGGHQMVTGSRPNEGETAPDVKVRPAGGE